MNAMKTYADTRIQGPPPRTVRLLFVADNHLDVEVIRVMLRLCPRTKFQVEPVGSTEECLEALRVNSFDLILLDHNLPGVDGLSFLKSLDHNGGLPPVIILTEQAGERVAEEAMRYGAYDCFPKDRLSSQGLARSIHRALETFWLNQRLEDIERVSLALATAVESRDPAIEGHLHRMAHYAPQLGQTLGVDQHQLRLLKCGGILHDIGKLGVSEAILSKPGPLTEAEWQEMRQHPIIGERICAPLKFLREIGPIIRHHHQRWDGEGYPDSLSGEEIPLLARVISVVDAFDAMSFDRPYRKALPPDEVVRRLSDGAGTQWDPEITQALLDLVRCHGLSRSEGEGRDSAAVPGAQAMATPRRHTKRGDDVPRTGSADCSRDESSQQRYFSRRTRRRRDAWP